MLVLSRKIGESVAIEGVGTLHVVRCTGNGCKLAFDLPKSINIVRTELLGEQGSSQDDERMDCVGHEAPSFDHDPLLVGGKFGP